MMSERSFIVLRYAGYVPAMAGCKKCKRKFFTPDTYSRDALGAREYLVTKFDYHSCEEPPRNQKSNLEKVLASLNCPYRKLDLEKNR